MLSYIAKIMRNIEGHWARFIREYRDEIASQRLTKKELFTLGMFAKDKYVESDRIISLYSDSKLGKFLGESTKKERYIFGEYMIYDFLQKASFEEMCKAFHQAVNLGVVGSNPAASVLGSQETDPFGNLKRSKSSLGFFFTKEKKKENSNHSITEVHCSDKAKIQVRFLLVRLRLDIL